MVSVVSSGPTGGNFNFLRHINTKFKQKGSEMSDLCYLGKPRVLFLNLCLGLATFCSKLLNRDLIMRQHLPPQKVQILRVYYCDEPPDEVILQEVQFAQVYASRGP